MSVCLSVCLFVCPSVSLSKPLSVCPSLVRQTATQLWVVQKVNKSGSQTDSHSLADNNALFYSYNCNTENRFVTEITKLSSISWQSAKFTMYNVMSSTFSYICILLVKIELPISLTYCTVFAFYSCTCRKLFEILVTHLSVHVQIVSPSSCLSFRCFIFKIKALCA